MATKKKAKKKRYWVNIYKATGSGILISDFPAKSKRISSKSNDIYTSNKTFDHVKTISFTL